MHEPSNEDQYFILCDNPGKQKKKCYSYKLLILALITLALFKFMLIAWT